ncbi:MAG TPA: hypothetical protein EYN52_09265 [Alphaproteobacteria bacterium]|nr:hypothetical protein [Alphaproteobacteria bacterium]
MRRLISNQLEERIDHDADRQLLTARRSRLSFSVGRPVSVRLDEADTITGGLTFSLADFDPPNIANARDRFSKRHRR